MIWYGLLLPFLGTALGAGCVLFMRSNLRPELRRMLTGFAAGDWILVGHCFSADIG